MYTAVIFTEPLWLPHIAVFQAKSMRQFLKLISLHNYRVVIRITFSYWFSGPQWFATQSQCSR